jgi:hypothetical protein
LHSTLSGSASAGDAGGMYSSSYSGSYTSRGSDVSIFKIATHFFYYLFSQNHLNFLFGQVGGNSYSSLYSGRNLGSSSGGYYGGSGSSSYY